VGDSYVIAHNAQFDYNFISYELKFWKLNQINEKKIRCSCAIFTDLFKNDTFKSKIKGFSLGKCCEFFKINVNSEGLHSALYDSLLLGKLICSIYTFIDKNPNYIANKKLIDLSQFNKISSKEEYKKKFLIESNLKNKMSINNINNDNYNSMKEKNYMNLNNLYKEKIQLSDNQFIFNENKEISDKKPIIYECNFDKHILNEEIVVNLAIQDPIINNDIQNIRIVSKNKLNRNRIINKDNKKKKNDNFNFINKNTKVDYLFNNNKTNNFNNNNNLNLNSDFNKNVIENSDNLDENILDFKEKEIKRFADISDDDFGKNEKNKKDTFESQILEISQIRNTNIKNVNFINNIPLIRNNQFQLYSRISKLNSNSISNLENMNDNKQYNKKINNINKTIINNIFINKGNTDDTKNLDNLNFICKNSFESQTNIKYK